MVKEIQIMLAALFMFAAIVYVGKAVVVLVIGHLDSRMHRKRMEVMSEFKEKLKRQHNKIDAIVNRYSKKR